jgi:hypothetical protein
MADNLDDLASAARATNDREARMWQRRIDQEVVKLKDQVWQLRIWQGLTVGVICGIIGYLASLRFHFWFFFWSN